MRNGTARVDSAFRIPHSAFVSVLNVALTGNIAAGKSTVVDLFRRGGATISDADELARQAQGPGGAVLVGIAQRFGVDVLAADGSLDRAALRGKVMGDQAALDALNAIVHPGVRRRRDELVREAAERGDILVVNDIPLLFEVLDPAQFDAVVLVDASVALRRTRLRDMRGLSNEDADRMIAAQMPAERKRAQSEFTIENERSLKTLERKARSVFDELRRRAATAALGRPARALLLVARPSDAKHPALTAIGARYGDAGLAVRRVTDNAAALDKALDRPSCVTATITSTSNARATVRSCRSASPITHRESSATSCTWTSPRWARRSRAGTCSAPSRR